ncbi:MAG: ribosome maturation factor RimM [Enterobacteriaceae bacterium PSpicST2]|nr:MAG: ribosome maturation factor RimM [Enterobacteriaceae bacterium PSpicST2]WMC19155.1 MAG: ribosome maturation factor RimM [Enterobacteriaceae bacterium PSpicST1]
MKKIPKKPIIIGKISKNYGINNLFKLFSFTKIKKNIFIYKPLYIKNKKWKIITIEYYIKKNNFFIIKIKNIKNKKKKINNKNIYIDFNNLKNINYYSNNILKCKIINFNNYKLGIIKNIIETKFNDLIVVKNKKKELIIPFIIKKIIKKIDIKLKIIKLKWNF